MMKSFKNQTLSTTLCIFAFLLTISLTIFTRTVEAKLRSVSERKLGQVDEPKEDRHLQDLKILGSNPSGTLTLCQGDCDKHEDCEGDLICYHRNKDDPDPVPGCSGRDSSRTDYCIIDPGARTTPSPTPAPVPATQAPTSGPTQAPVPVPTPVPTPPVPTPAPTPPLPTPLPTPLPSQLPTPLPTPLPTTVPATVPATGALKFIGSDPNNKLLACQGDCDDDGDCAGDLVCFKKNRGERVDVPGCSGSDNSNNDFCVAPSGNGNAPSPTRPPVGGPVSSLSNFRLKLYWRQGYYWQESRSERKWCMRCRDNGCQRNEKSYIYSCSGNSQHFDFAPVEGKYVQIQIHNKDLCFQRSNNDIYMKDCDDTNDDQLWFPKVGSFDGTSFEISPKRASSKCITQRHHPKSGEEVALESCSLARTSDTSKWNRY